MPRSALLLALLALVACGDAPSPHSSPDAPVQPVDAAAPDAPDDAPIDADPRGDAPRIDGVLTADGFAELRQGEAADLVIRGARLTGATEVTLGALTAAIVEPGDATLRVHVSLPHGFAPQPLALTVTTPRGTDTRAAAITATPYVVTATARLGGHGTTQSPLDLCDPVIATAAPGDTIALAAGTYTCTARLSLQPGVAVLGAGAATTVLDGFGGLEFQDSLTALDTVVADLTLRAPRAPGPAILVGPRGGDLRVRGVTVDGGSATGLAVEGVPDGNGQLPAAVLDHFVYTATGTAAQLDARAQVAASQLTGCAVGVALGDGTLTVTASQITDCAIGVRFGVAGVRAVTPAALQLTGTTLLGATTGVAIVQASAVLTGVTIARSDARGCETGVAIADGSLAIASHSQLDCAGTAIDADGDTSLEDAQAITITDSDVLGGARGVHLGAANDPSPLRVRTSHLHGGTIAAIALDDNQALCDLGTPADPGNNTLTTTTGFAFRDNRPDADPIGDTTTARGTTLNGHDYTGQSFDGPTTSSTDYSLRAGTHLTF